MNMNGTQHKMGKASDSDSDGEGYNRLQIKEKAKKRPRGGRKSIYMDEEEVKACKELGFELEDHDDDDHDHDGNKEESHKEEEKYYHMPLERISTNRLSLSRQYSSTCNGTGDNSPIQNWRISSPGDDPRDVKARLKVWAQAVALESTSQLQN